MNSVLSGCTVDTDDERNKFVGTWRMELVPIYTYTFYANGTVITRESNHTYNLTYEIEEGILSFYMSDYPNDPLSYYYSFSEGDNRLTLTLLQSSEDTFDLIKIK